MAIRDFRSYWYADAVGALVLFAAGGFAVFTAAAEQSYLPDLVPRRLLVIANARTGQSATLPAPARGAPGEVLRGHGQTQARRLPRRWS